MENKHTLKKFISLLPPAGILFLIVFVRVYNIATVPLGMHIDEVGLGLNAWSIANFGTDRYGHFMPVCPINFYGEQSAFYTYFCALFVRLFGLNIYTLRLPGVIMGILAVLFGALLLKEKWGKKGFYTGLLLMGIFPYFIMNCRFALDCNVMLGALSIALYALVRLLKKTKVFPKKNFYGSFALVGLLFGIVLYTYIISALVIAVFGVVFGVYYLLYTKENRKIRFYRLVCLTIPLVILVIPLILVICVNRFGLEPISTPFFTIPRLAVDRTQEVAFSLSDLPGKLRGLVHTLTSDGKYGSSDRYLTMYPWSIPFVLLGGIFSLRDGFQSLREKKPSLDICMLIITLAETVMFLFCGQYNYHINGIFVALAYFCVNGILSTLSLLKWHRVQFVCCALLACLYAVSFAGFAKEYFSEKNSTAAYQVYNGVYETIQLLDSTQQNRDIYIMDEVGEFYFLSAPVSPEEFLAGCDELGYIKDYKNLHFYEPAIYEAGNIYICNKASGRYQALLQTGIIDNTYTLLESTYYYAFYKK